MFVSSKHHHRHAPPFIRISHPTLTPTLDAQLRVDRINDKYGDGNSVVYFEERKEKDMRLAQRLAFFAASDILMITPTRSSSRSTVSCLVLVLV